MHLYQLMGLYTLGSVLASFTNAAGGATLKGNQVFGPYGNARYFQGNINTTKGFTGQYNNGLTGLDYYNARYYDPVAGVFLSADKAIGNNAGVNPFAYVEGNPESYSDPSGLIGVPYNPFTPGSNYNSPSAVQARTQATQDLGTLVGLSLFLPEVAIDAKEWFLGLPLTFSADELGQDPFVDEAVNVSSLNTNDTPVETNGTSTTTSGVFPAGDLTTGTSGDVTAQLDSEVNAIKVADAQRDGAANDTPSTTENTTPEPTGDTNTPVTPNGECSFTSGTQIATSQGEQPIGKLQTGEKVLAYNPKTHQMEQQPILHVWVHTDDDLVDMTLTTTTTAPYGKPATKTSEVIHTNQKHPFLTKEKGFLPVGQIKLGMHVLRADGIYGVVTGWKVVPGTSVMYNLEVAQDHTFTVGAGEWVVHNCTSGPTYQPDEVPTRVRDLASGTDTERTASGTQRMVSVEASTPNFAGAQVENLDGSFDLSWIWRSSSQGHAEELAVDWASGALDWLSGLSDTAQFRVTLVTQYYPCSESCAVAIDTGRWANTLQEAADGRLQSLEFWHYMDNGLFRRIYPSP